MKHKFKELTLELCEDNLGYKRVRLDNVLNNQYIEVLSTTDKLQAVLLYQDLYDVLKKHEESWYVCNYIYYLDNSRYGDLL